MMETLAAWHALERCVMDVMRTVYSSKESTHADTKDMIETQIQKT